MPLTKILNKKALNVLGLNSGTSSDSLDLAVLKIVSNGTIRTVKYIEGKTVKYPKVLKTAILSLCDADKIEPDDIIYLDNILGQFYGKSAMKFIECLFSRNIKIDMIASHGQTVRHLPVKIKKYNTVVNGTMQLGSADLIATLTGKIVVNDFRQADIAIGNEGAPITVGAMEILLGSAKEPRLIVNIGGMSNYFYLPTSRTSRKLEGIDCGPGNSLSDILTQIIFNKPYDKNGFHASQGNISKRLMLLLQSNDFYKSKIKSTGREVFGLKLAKEILAFSKRLHLSGNDVIATVADLTSRSIAMKVQYILKKDRKIEKLYLTGGGRNNIFMMSRLKHHLPTLEILPVENLGINGDLLEAASYAVMGEACLRSQALNKRVAFGTKQKYMGIMGKITQPPYKHE